MAARRSLGLADDLDAFGLQVVVPLLQVPHVERDVRQADAVPGHGPGRLLRLELEDLEDAAAGHANPADLARRRVVRRRRRTSARDRAACRRRRRAGSRTPPSRTARPVEVGHGDADMAERSSSHSRSPSDQVVPSNVIGDAQRLRRNRQRRIDGGRRGEERGVDDEQVLDVVRAAVRCRAPTRADRCRTRACRTGASCSCAPCECVTTTQNPSWCRMRLVSFTSIRCACRLFGR